jgi:Xaa-Pro aminopeptidase
MNFAKRIKNLQHYISDKKLDLLIIEDQISLMYLTGLHLSFGKLFLTPSLIKLFVDGRYIQAAKENSNLDVDIANEKSLSDFILQNKCKSVGFDTNKVSYYSYEKLLSFIQKIKVKVDYDINLIPIFNPLKDFRLIKDTDEISLLKKAASLNWKGFEHICLFLKEGITEKELALEYELFVRKNGGISLSFDPIVCFGKNSSMPHHIPTDEKLKLNDIVLIDVGVCIDNYHSDLTRVVFFGTPNDTLEKLYSITKKAQAKALLLCKPGTKLKDLDTAVRDVFKEEDFEKYYLHSLGHGVGLEIHEFPRIKFDGEDKDTVLQPGMIITIEPGLYISDLGGVRYEDTILITKSGYENFYL